MIVFLDSVIWHVALSITLTLNTWNLLKIIQLFLYMQYVIVLCGFTFIKAQYWHIISKKLLKIVLHPQTETYVFFTRCTGGWLKMLTLKNTQISLLKKCSQFFPHTYPCWELITSGTTKFNISSYFVTKFSVQECAYSGFHLNKLRTLENMYSVLWSLFNLH